MRKMDEMEIAITLKSVKWAWGYTVLFLFIWAIYDYMKLESFNSPAFILLISQNLIKRIIEQYLKWKMSKNEE